MISPRRERSAAPFPPFFVRVWAVTLLVLCAGCGSGRELGAPEELSLLTRDGVRLAGTYYPPPAPHAPSLILLHGLGEDRSVWREFGRRTQQQGYGALAIDLRGHGESRRKGDAKIDYGDFDEADWMKVGLDIAASKEALLDRGADSENIAAIGADVSANVLLHHAHGDWDIQAVVLLSPGLEYEGVETEPVMAAYGKRPTLMLYTTGDTYSASSVRELHRISEGFTEIREYQGAAHGADIVRRSNNAVNHIFLWLSQILVPQD